MSRDGRTSIEEHPAEVVRRMRLGQQVSLGLADNSVLSGTLRDCEGDRVRLTDGRTVPLTELREVVAHRRPWPDAIPVAGEADGRHW